MGRHFGAREGDLYYTKANGLVTFDQLPNWYGIEGIRFQYINDNTDPRIWYKGRDCSCYVVEDTMWDRFHEDMGEDAMEALTIGEQYGIFASFMEDNADDVKELCEAAMFPETYCRKVK